MLLFPNKSEFALTQGNVFAQAEVGQPPAPETARDTCFYLPSDAKAQRTSIARTNSILSERIAF